MVPTLPTFNDVSPRIGGNFDLLGDGTTSLNAFYGRFYEEAHGYAFDELRSPPSGLLWPVVGRRRVSRVVLRQLLSSTAASIPTLRNQYSNQFVVGVDRQVTDDVAVTARYVHKKTHDIYSYQDVRTVFEPVTVVTAWGDPLQVYNAPDGFNRFRYLMNDPWEGLFGESFREYNGVQFKVVKRLADNWSLIGSLLIQKSEGNNRATLGNMNHRDSPNDFVNNPGELPSSRRYVSKIQGTYRIPMPVDTQLGWIVNWMSGGRQHAEERIRYYIDPVTGEEVRFGQLYVTVPIEQVGATVKDTQFRIDLRVDKKFPLRGPWGEMGIVLDVFNVFNDDAVSYIYTRVDQGIYGDPAEIIRPRTWRLGLRWLF